MNQEQNFPGVFNHAGVQHTEEVVTLVKGMDTSFRMSGIAGLSTAYMQHSLRMKAVDILPKSELDFGKNYRSSGTAV